MPLNLSLSIKRVGSKDHIKVGEGDGHRSFAAQHACKSRPLSASMHLRGAVKKHDEP